MRRADRPPQTRAAPSERSSERAEGHRHKAALSHPTGSTVERPGPFETEREAAAAARHIYDLPPGAWDAAARKMLKDACAGIDLGLWDRQIIEWLAGWEPSTVAVIAGLIIRAGQARAGSGEP